jgi:hypothetical protein
MAVRWNPLVLRAWPRYILPNLPAPLRYYGYYSNVSRGKRRQERLDDAIPCILETQGSEKAFRKSWARLLQKIYEIDPPVCPKCQGTMRIISSLEDPSVIRRIACFPSVMLMPDNYPPPNSGVKTITSTCLFG